MAHKSDYGDKSGQGKVKMMKKMKLKKMVKRKMMKKKITTPMSGGTSHKGGY